MFCVLTPKFFVVICKSVSGDPELLIYARENIIVKKEVAEFNQCKWKLRDSRPENHVAPYVIGTKKQLTIEVLGMNCKHQAG